MFAYNSDQKMYILNKLNNTNERENNNLTIFDFIKYWCIM